MKKSKQARAREFSPETRQAIIRRDRGKCIFCQMHYQMGENNEFAKSILSIMHYISRAHNGLGIEENGALGCIWHHEMLDNGNTGRRDEMLNMFKEYLKEKYPDWDEERLVYSKWD